MHTARAAFLRQRRAAAVLQARWRALAAGRAARAALAQQHAAAAALQAAWRGTLQRRAFLGARAAAVQVRQQRPASNSTDHVCSSILVWLADDTRFVPLLLHARRQQHLRTAMQWKWILPRSWCSSPACATEYIQCATNISDGTGYIRMHPCHAVLQQGFATAYEKCGKHDSASQ